MKLLIIGINHKTAPIKLRGRLAFSAEQIQQSLQEITRFSESAFIVSTCNRTEIYVLASEHKHPQQKNTHSNFSQKTSKGLESIDSTLARLKEWLAETKRVSPKVFENHLYIYANNQALNHWIRVSAGLDSMILGEPQILGQMKKALSIAFDNGALCNTMTWMADQVLAAAKQVRHDTDIGKQAVTLGFATAKIASQIFADLSTCQLLIVASGEMNRLVAKHITSLGVKKVIICNRTVVGAEKLAAELHTVNPLCQTSVKPLHELEDCLQEADIVCSCSASMEPLISFATMKPLIKKRKYRPMLMVDLAVPRDIEEKVAKLDEIYLYSIDDLTNVVEGNIEQRKQAAVDAELMISQLVVDINMDYRARIVGSEIHSYRQVANERADIILQEFLQQLPADVDNEIISQMTELSRRLTQTLTHAPSKLIRKVAKQGEDQALEIVVSTLIDSYRE